MFKGIAILTLILIMTIPLYGEEEVEPLAVTEPSKETEPSQEESVSTDRRLLFYRERKEFASFSNWINLEPYKVRMDKDRERSKIREDWRRFFGLDFFYPYFEAEKVTKNVEKKGKVKVLKLQGEPEIREEEVKYIFHSKF